MSKLCSTCKYHDVAENAPPCCCCRGQDRYDPENCVEIVIYGLTVIIPEIEIPGIIAVLEAELRRIEEERK